MRIASFIHKGLKRLYEQDSVRGVPPEAADKLRKMLAFLESMDDGKEMLGLPSWKAHLLTGDRKETWSLAVTRNWRLTFYIERAEHEIRDLNLEDYH
jgi:proteic killer suppression protein